MRGQTMVKPFLECTDEERADLQRRIIENDKTKPIVVGQGEECTMCGQSLTRHLIISDEQKDIRIRAFLCTTCATHARLFITLLKVFPELPINVHLVELPKG
jgi:hypothetical protein